MTVGDGDRHPGILSFQCRHFRILRLTEDGATADPSDGLSTHLLFVHHVAYPGMSLLGQGQDSDMSCPCLRELNTCGCHVYPNTGLPNPTVRHAFRCNSVV